MRYLGLVVLLLGAASASAEESASKWRDVKWDFGRMTVLMRENLEQGVTLSEDCWKKTDKPCEARRVIEKIKIPAEFDKKLVGGKNPGSVLCHELPEGEMLFAKNPWGHQATFCRFKDGSIVPSGVLFAQARKNTYGGR